MKLAVESYLFYLFLAFLSLFVLDVASLYQSFHRLHMCRDALAYSVELSDGDWEEVLMRMEKDPVCEGIDYELEYRKPRYFVHLSLPFEMKTIQLDKTLQFSSLVHVKK